MSSSLETSPFQHLTQRAARLLAHLAQKDAQARPCSISAGMLSLSCVRGGVTLGAGRARLVDAEALVAAGLARWTAKPMRGLCITAAGITAAGRQPAGGAARMDPIIEMRAGEPAAVNPAESPLAWLHRRKGPDGRPLIDAAAFAAGERLRQDVTLAGALPSVSANWSSAVASHARGPHRLEAGEAMVAARQRLDKAMRAVGPEFAGLLLDVCGFLKGLEQVERERGWPARSGKIVLGLALARLAAHYGIAAEARGPSQGRMRRWQGEGARPSLPPAQTAAS